MKYSRVLPVASVLFLAACSQSSSSVMSLNDRLQNPLYAQRYYEDLVDHMVSLELHNDPVLKNAQAKAAIDQTRMQGVQKAQDEAKLRDQGTRGAFVSDSDEAQGTVLIVNNTLYFGTDFFLSPGPSVHVYLTTAEDPRAVTFPDKTAVDVGSIEDVYGAQSFSLPDKTNTTPTYHSVVLFDTQLKKLFGFAQLSQ